MATNVSEKDKTLNEIIDWCENQRRKILADIEPAPGEDAEEAYADLESVIRSDNPIIKYSNDLLDGSEAFVYGVIMQARLLDHIIDTAGPCLAIPAICPVRCRIKARMRKMKWKPDWSDIAENLLIGLMAVAAAAIFIVFCVCTWEEVTTARTIIMRDGNQSYACTVSDISLAPHDCNPIEDAK